MSLPCAICGEETPRGFTHRDDSTKNRAAHVVEKVMPDGVVVGVRASADPFGILYTWYIQAPSGAAAGGSARGLWAGCGYAEERYERSRFAEVEAQRREQDELDTQDNREAM